jgi:hypothetical protein
MICFRIVRLIKNQKQEDFKCWNKLISKFKHRILK